MGTGAATPPEPPGRLRANVHAAGMTMCPFPALATLSCSLAQRARCQSGHTGTYEHALCMMMRSWHRHSPVFLGTRLYQTLSRWLPNSRQSRAAGCPARRPQGQLRRSVRPVRTEGLCSSSMSIFNENDQANRAISTGKLHTLLRFHTRPINVVVFHGSDREHSFSGGFPA